MVFVAQMVGEEKKHFESGWFFEVGAMLSQVPERMAYDAADGRRAQSEKRQWSVFSPDQVRAGIEGIFVQSFPQHGLQWLLEIGFFSVWLPEVAALVHLSEETGMNHKDVWEHTKQVVFQAAARPLVRWAALLHDIGKVPTRTLDEKGAVHFYGHAEVGAQMFDVVQARLGFDAAQAPALRFLIEAHLRANQYQSTWTDAAVRRFARDAGVWCADLLDLSRADVTSAIPGKKERARLRVDELETRIQTLRDQDARRPPLPSGLGKALMEQLGLPASPLIGQIKQKLEHAIEHGQIESHRDLEYYIALAKELKTGL